MTSRLFRLALRLVPAAWRAPVARDLEEEASGGRHGTLWCAWYAAQSGVRLRLVNGPDAILTELRYVIRSLRRAKGFTAAAVLTFSLGIGANIAVFSIFDRLLFRPLPYADPARLVHIHQYAWTEPFSAALLPFEISAGLARSARSFDGIAWADGGEAPVVPAAGETPLILTPVTPNALTVLGVHPIRGRDFADADVAAGADRAVLLAYETWHSRYGSADDVLTLTWRVGPMTYRIAGVLPRGFLLPSTRFVERFDGLVAQRDGRLGPGAMTVAPFARLRAGVSIEAARAEVSEIIPALAHEMPGSVLLQQAAAGPLRVTVQSLQSGLTLLVKPYLWLISAAVWIVLTVACVNLATLLLARGRSRQQDVAIRAAVGASTGRLAGAALLEALVLCALSSTVALLVCAWGHAALLAIVPPAFRGFAVSPFDARIVAITLVVAFASAATAGLLPALGIRRVDVLTVLQRGARVSRLAPLRSGAALLALEAAFGAALVVGGATTVPGFVSLLLRSPGFDAQNLFVLTVHHGGLSGPRSARENADRVRTVLEIASQLPHVEASAATLRAPFGDVFGTSPFWKAHGLEGHDWAVSASIFQTMRTPIVAGRTFSDDEVSASALVAVVNESGARVLWPGDVVSRAIGRTVRTTEGDRQVVGVVADTRGRPGGFAAPALYLPVTAPETDTKLSSLAVLVRMTSGAIPDRDLIRARLNASVQPSSVQIQSVATLMTPYLERPRFLAILFGALAVVALVLSATGLFAVATFETARRQHESGVRLSLGASARDIRRMLAARIVQPVIVGTVAGLALTWWASRYFETVVSGASARAPWAYALAAVLVVATGVAATWYPVRRAGRADLVSILRAS